MKRDDPVRWFTAEEQAVLEEWAAWFAKRGDKGMRSHLFSTDVQEGETDEICPSTDGN